MKFYILSLAEAFTLMTSIPYVKKGKKQMCELFFF